MYAWGITLLIGTLATVSVILFIVVRMTNQLKRLAAEQRISSIFLDPPRIIRVQSLIPTKRDDASILGLIRVPPHMVSLCRGQSSYESLTVRGCCVGYRRAPSTA